MKKLETTLRKLFSWSDSSFSRLTLLIICLILFLGMFWLNKKNILIEGNVLDDIQKNIDKGDEETTGGFNYVFGKVVSVLRGKTKEEPKWNDLDYSEGEMVNGSIDLYDSKNIPALETEVINDNCNSRSMLKSDYQYDICERYVGDHKTINEKCRGLGKKSCNLMNCCILLNGNKCVAGNGTGPTYYTDNGTEITFDYYEFKGQRIPQLPDDTNYTNKCAVYADNSTGISYDCMAQMFNELGCANPNPDTTITSDYMTKNIKSTKRYIRNDLSMKVHNLKNTKNDEANVKKDKMIKCGGAVTECDQFYSTDKNVSSSCMEEFFIQKRLEKLKKYYYLTDSDELSDASLNEVENFITENYVSDNAKYTKRELLPQIETKIDESITRMKEKDEDNILYQCRNYKDDTIDVSRECMNYMFKYAGCPDGDYMNVIDDNYYNRNRRTPRKVIQADLNKKVALYKKNQGSNVFDNDDTIRCEGHNSVKRNCDAYYNNEKNVSENCMKDMFEKMRDDQIKNFNNDAKNIKLNRTIVAENIPNFINSEYAETNKNDTKIATFNKIKYKIMKMIEDFKK